MPTDPNYIGAELPLYESPADDVDCGEIEARNFFSIGSDPHGLDRDKDGLACEEGGSQQPQDFNRDGKPDIFWRNRINGYQTSTTSSGRRQLSCPLRGLF